MNLLITAGATREPIDDVRYISNVSTGATGAMLAEAWAGAGHNVVLLRGEGAVGASGIAEEERFSSANDLTVRLQRRLGTGVFQAVIMAAAVADFHVVGVTTGKLSSDVERRTLELARNPKILPRLKSFSLQPLSVVGFKLTAGADDAAIHAAVAAQFVAGGVDVVVHNDLAAIRASSRENHPFSVYRPPPRPAQDVRGAPALARLLAEILVR